MSELLSAYKITIKVGEKLFAGHVDNSLILTPNYEPILRKSLGGAFDLDFTSLDLALGVSGLMYKRTAGEVLTHDDYAYLRAACNNVASVAFVYGETTPGETVISGYAKLNDYQETTESGKSPGRWSCKLKSIRGTVRGAVIPPAVQYVRYGLLYNWYAATDARNIANTGWHVPNRAERTVLITYLGGASIAGGKLKETGLTYWSTPNTGASNSSNYNARGAGVRVFGSLQLKGWSYLWTSEAFFQGGLWWGYMTQLYYANSQADALATYGYYGVSIRLLKDSTSLTHGQSGTYTGNDGKVYRSICIGTQEWLADNLAETKFRTGEDIPEVTDNAAWAALTTAGMCAYNNDHSNI